jgi:hypothetical protein
MRLTANCGSLLHKSLHKICELFSQKLLKTLRSPCDTPVLSEGAGLRGNGGALSHVEQYPFVLSLSQHELASARGL